MSQVNIGTETLTIGVYTELGGLGLGLGHPLQFAALRRMGSAGESINAEGLRALFANPPALKLALAGKAGSVAPHLRSAARAVHAVATGVYVV